ncbi:MAG: cyclase family protein [Owenweeksia sp.]
MKITLEHLGRKYRTNLSKGIDLSSVLGHPKKELRAWHVPPVLKEPVKGDGWVGSVKEGSPVNFYDIRFNPHGNGTHTEGYGHISGALESVNDQFSQFHSLAYLLEVTPEKRGDDKVITLANIRSRIKKWNFESLILRTGNYPEGHDFSDTNPPYLEPELVKFIREMGVQHLLLDLPSVDRESDGGKVLAHKLFWDFPDEPREGCTITEMIRVPEGTSEGLYLLNLQVAPFHNDASPSRPLIFPLEELS